MQAKLIWTKKYERKRKGRTIYYFIFRRFQYDVEMEEDGIKTKHINPFTEFETNLNDDLNFYIAMENEINTALNEVIDPIITPQELDSRIDIFFKFLEKNYPDLIAYNIISSTYLDKNNDLNYTYYKIVCSLKQEREQARELWLQSQARIHIAYTQYINTEVFYFLQKHFTWEQEGNGVWNMEYITRKRFEQFLAQSQNSFMLQLAYAEIWVSEGLTFFKYFDSGSYGYGAKISGTSILKFVVLTRLSV